jgi:hypothetical protein
MTCVDACDQPCRSVPDGEFVAPGGNGPVVLEPADPALGSMRPLVVGPVELRRSPTVRAAPEPVADPVRRVAPAMACWWADNPMRRRAAALTVGTR